jgi:hypothetical protein
LHNPFSKAKSELEVVPKVEALTFKKTELEAVPEAPEAEAPEAPEAEGPEAEAPEAEAPGVEAKAQKIQMLPHHWFHRKVHFLRRVLDPKCVPLICMPCKQPSPSRPVRRKGAHRTGQIQTYTSSQNAFPFFPLPFT